jgi:hypothetical protein
VTSVRKLNGRRSPDGNDDHETQILAVRGASGWISWLGNRSMYEAERPQSLHCNVTRPDGSTPLRFGERPTVEVEQLGQTS